MNLEYPFFFDGSGRTAQTDPADHVRDMIEQVLFTAPGERVNRPTFGCGLLQIVFAPNSDLLAAATQTTVHAALQQALGDLIDVRSVDVTTSDSTLRVTLSYLIRPTGEVKTQTFTTGGGAA